MDIRTFLWGDLSADRWEHGPRLIVRGGLVVILRESTVVSIDIGVSARPIRLVLDANISIDHLGSVELARASESACHYLGSTLNLRTIQW